MTNICDEIPAELPQEFHERLVDTGTVTIERIISRGHTSPASGWYDQDRHEWVMVIQGAAVLGFDDGTRLSLQAGDHLTIPAHQQHRVEWTDPGQDTIWLAVFFPKDDQ